MTTDTSFTPPQTAADIYAMVDSYKRVPLDRARQLLAIANSETGKRDYLHSVGSGYANADYEIMTGAFNGHVLQALASLADAYEQEIAPPAAPLPVPALSTSITSEQVRQLRDEASAAFDLEQVRICNAALEGDGTAWAIWEKVIAEAAAMAAGDNA